jgi:PEP-CTERM motif-containing protein
MTRALLSGLASAAIGLAAAATPAQAAIVVCAQGTSCVSNTTNVNLGAFTNASSVTGNVGINGPLVTFNSTDGNLSTNSGAATVFRTDGGLLTNLTFTILSGFTAAEFNLENGSPSSFLVNLTDSGGDVFSQTLSSLNGSNIFNIVAPAGTTYTSATFSSSGGGFQNFKQLRVTTAAAVAVPEPVTWAMMLLGFGGIGMVLRRSRRAKTVLRQVA